MGLVTGPIPNGDTFHFVMLLRGIRPYEPVGANALHSPL